jgi:hypothetical protein
MGKTTLRLSALLSMAAPLAAGVAVVPEAARTGSHGLRATALAVARAPNLGE